jgi:hypothetical protein
MLEFKISRFDPQISPKVDLPVGRNLQDHPNLATFPFTINESLSYIPERDFGLGTLIEYFFRGEG